MTDFGFNTNCNALRFFKRMVNDLLGKTDFTKKIDGKYVSKSEYGESKWRFKQNKNGEYEIVFCSDDEELKVMITMIPEKLTNEPVFMVKLKKGGAFLGKFDNLCDDFTLVAVPCKDYEEILDLLKEGEKLLNSDEKDSDIWSEDSEN